MSFLTRVFGDPNEKEIRRIRPLVDRINGLEDELIDLSDDDLRARTADFRAQLDQAEDQDAQDDLLDEILPAAFATVREAGKRTNGMR
ncbi:MAG: hypothetical protein H0X24_21110, partial [Ktedonobacterales bacterium]|nr:hypothetical protein [Ktedonobacterales bacterium]